MCGSSKKQAAIRAYKAKLVLPGVTARHSSLLLQECTRVGTCRELLFSPDGFKATSSSSLIFTEKPLTLSDKEVDEVG